MNISAEPSSFPLSPSLDLNINGHHFLYLNFVFILLSLLSTTTIPPPTLFSFFLMQDIAIGYTAGALFLGIVFCALLFGINLLQSYFYFHEFPNDTRLQKASVFILCFLDTFHLSLVVHAVYTYLVMGFLDPAGLAVIVWSIKAQVSVNVVVILIVQSLYTKRVCLLGSYHRGPLSYLVVSVVGTGFVVGVLFAYLLCTTPTYIEMRGISWVIELATSIATVIDFTIAAAMCYYLKKSKGDRRELNSKISTIIQYTLASGLLTSACSLSALFVYILLPNTLVFLGLQFSLTKLYVGSYLAMLNARERTSNAPNSSFAGRLSVDVWHPNASHTSRYWNTRPLSTATVTAATPASPTSETGCQKIGGQC